MIRSEAFGSQLRTQPALESRPAKYVIPYCPYNHTPLSTWRQSGCETQHHHTSSRSSLSPNLHPAKRTIRRKPAEKQYQNFALALGPLALTDHEVTASVGYHSTSCRSHLKWRADPDQQTLLDLSIGALSDDGVAEEILYHKVSQGSPPALNEGAARHCYGRWVQQRGSHQCNCMCNALKL